MSLSKALVCAPRVPSSARRDLHVRPWTHDALLTLVRSWVRQSQSYPWTSGLGRRRLRLDHSTRFLHYGGRPRAYWPFGQRRRRRSGESWDGTRRLGE